MNNCNERPQYDVVDSSKYKQYIRYQLATTEVSEETQEVLNKLEGDVELQAQYLRTIEEEKRQKEIFEEVDKRHKQKVKNINRFSIAVGVYLLLVFPISYWFTDKIDLELVNAIGAIGLTLFMSLALIIIIVIRAFALQYQDIKSGIVQRKDLTIQGMSGVILLAAILLVLFI